MAKVLGAIGSIFSDPNRGMKRQLMAMQQQQVSDQGRQLADTATSQAEVDMESAGLRKPGRGRKMLSFDENASSTYGG